MKLYICQTVRHIMVSILHASLEPCENVTIIVNVEHQNLSEESFNLEGIRSFFNSIEFIFINESELLANINNTNLLAYNELLARNIYIGKNGINTISKLLAKKLPSSDKLFIFHEEVLLSKIWKVHSNVELFDDGLANYSYRQVKHPLKRMVRMLKLKNPTKYIYGESSKFQSINLTCGKPEQLPSKIKNKAIIFDYVAQLGKSDLNKALNAFFKMPSIFKVKNILLTQNLDGAGVYSKGEKIKIYEHLISKIQRLLPEPLLLKLHPSENKADYRELERKYSIKIIDASIPFELFSTLINSDCKVVSLYTTAEIVNLNTNERNKVCNILQGEWNGWPSYESMIEKITTKEFR